MVAASSTSSQNSSPFSTSGSSHSFFPLTEYERLDNSLDPLTKELVNFATRNLGSSEFTNDISQIISSRGVDRKKAEEAYLKEHPRSFPPIEYILRNLVEKAESPSTNRFIEFLCEEINLDANARFYQKYLQSIQKSLEQKTLTELLKDPDQLRKLLLYIYKQSRFYPDYDNQRKFDEITITTLARSALPKLNELSPVNNLDFLSQEEINDQEGVIFITENGQKFYLDSIIRFHNNRGYKGTSGEQYRQKLILNPNTNDFFSINDTKNIIREIVSNNKVIKDLHPNLLVPPNQATSLIDSCMYRSLKDFYTKEIISRQEFTTRFTHRSRVHDLFLDSSGVGHSLTDILEYHEARNPIAEKGERENEKFFYNRKTKSFFSFEDTYKIINKMKLYGYTASQLHRHLLAPKGSVVPKENEYFTSLDEFYSNCGPFFWCVPKKKKCTRKCSLIIVCSAAIVAISAVAFKYFGGSFFRS
jgi:hypothetical protein